MIWLVGVVAAMSPSKSNAEHLDAILAESPPAFCRSESYPLTTEEAAWCSDPAALASRCPGFEAVCRSGKRARLSGLPGRFSGREYREGGSSGDRSSDDGGTTLFRVEPVFDPAKAGELTLVLTARHDVDAVERTFTVSSP